MVAAKGLWITELRNGVTIFGVKDTLKPLNESVFGCLHIKGQ